MTEHWIDPLRPIGEAADAHEELDRLFPWARPDEDCSLADRLRHVAERLEALEEIRQRVADGWVPDRNVGMWCPGPDVLGDDAVYEHFGVGVAAVLWPSTEEAS